MAGWVAIDTDCEQHHQALVRGGAMSICEEDITGVVNLALAANENNAFLRFKQQVKAQPKQLSTKDKPAPRSSMRPKLQVSTLLLNSLSHSNQKT